MGTWLFSDGLMLLEDRLLLGAERPCRAPAVGTREIEVRKQQGTWHRAAECTRLGAPAPSAPFV